MGKITLSGEENAGGEKAVVAKRENNDRFRREINVRRRLENSQRPGTY